jgi:hypothetical protein
MLLEFAGRDSQRTVFADPVGGDCAVGDFATNARFALFDRPSELGSRQQFIKLRNRHHPRLSAAIRDQ